ncbi:MAG: hypothetical protein A2Y10_16970 [Planctomycetes bacterium GWF2_41_51]|nr:MAG: hypothetical protein A2Y10_16970 [Planctomycetes bacterium GWF2_41_51]
MINKQTLSIKIVVIFLVCILTAIPAFALKVYVNPSIQTGNYSPDGAYQEAAGMQDVAVRLVNKLIGRGIEARNSGWLSLSGACTDSENWGSDCFVALHTDASGSGWTSTHGTTTLYWYNNPTSAYFAGICSDQVSRHFTKFGLNYNRGTSARSDLYVLNPSNQSAVPSALVEGLFHTNYNDVYGALMNDSGRQAYAEGVCAAVCKYYGIIYNEDGPSACSMNSNRIDMVSRGAYGQVVLDTWTSAVGWSTVSLGGVTYEAPAIVSRTNGILDAFCASTTGVLHQNHYENGNWSGWQNLNQTLASGPSVCSQNSNNITICARNGGNNQVYVRNWTTSGGWGSWVPLYGTTYDSPCIVSRASGTLDVFARGPDNKLYQKSSYDGGVTWTANWYNHNFVIGSAPAGVSRNSGNVELFFRGTNNNMMGHNWNSGGVWTLADYGGQISAVPAVAKRDSNTMDVFVRGTDDYLYQLGWTAAGGWWAGYYNMGYYY